MQEKRAALYVRYSDDVHQRQTSLEDQKRRCREIAEAAGYAVQDDLVFSDGGITGQESGFHKRDGYHRLIRAWESKRFDALVVDEASRLARDQMELAILSNRVEKSGVRLMTADGIDSTHPNWQLLLGIKGTLAVHEIRLLRHRVIRGMLGQLERGFDIASPAFGYRQVRDYATNGKSLGTHWVVDEGRAAVVREIFAMRLRGMSHVTIAAELNRRGIATSRPARNGGGRAYWRAGTVFQVLANKVYCGIFVWNGSAFSRAKARRENRKLDVQEFARPHLRLVEDAVWQACNGTGKVKFRSGRRHLVSGLATCGACGARLSVVSTKPPQVHCAQCYQAVRVGAAESWMGYVSANALVRVIRHVLHQLLTDAALNEFKARLRERLSGDQTAAVKGLEQTVASALRACERLARLVRVSETTDDVLSREYQAARAELLGAERELLMRKASVTEKTRAAIESQVQVNAFDVLDKLLDDCGHLERTQALLHRLLPRIALAARPRRFVAEFEVTLAQGVALATASETDVIEAGPVTVRVRVTSGAKRPTPWQVEIV
jgi:site-specific DNA recombinase